MATEVEERQQQNATTEQHGDGVTHAFILEQMQRGFAEVNARMDAGFAQSNARMDAGFAQSNARMDAEYDRLNSRMDAGFAQSNARMGAEYDRLNSRIDRLAVVLIAGQFAIVASIIGVAVASFLR